MKTILAFLLSLTIALVLPNKLFPDPAKRPRQQEALIDFYRKGKIDDAVRAFKRAYLDLFIRSSIVLPPKMPANSGY